MSTSDQQGHGPLTRKQLREIRLTGSTPVITEEEAAAAAAPPAPPTPPLPRAAEPVEIPPAPVEPEAPAGGALTRRQVRERERIRTASVPVVDETDAPALESGSAPEQVADTPPAAEETPEHREEKPAASAPQVVTEVPRFSPRPAPDAALTSDAAIAGGSSDEDEGADDDVVGVEPVSAAASTESVGDGVLEAEAVEAESDSSGDAVADLGLEPDAEHGDDADAADERPTVNPAFGQGVLGDRSSALPPSFDELLTAGESGGSAHRAPNALIFTPSPGEGSLSGPVASTGELLITGSYELPQGLGSQGHAHGTTDGKDVDAVLIDGELPPASSPTPIAASAAVSTSKSAGEVIRPPAPDKGNKLMLALAITAGGLALAVAVALVIAFTGNFLN